MLTIPCLRGALLGAGCALAAVGAIAASEAATTTAPRPHLSQIAFMCTSEEALLNCGYHNTYFNGGAIVPCPLPLPHGAKVIEGICTKSGIAVGDGWPGNWTYECKQAQGGPWCIAKPKISKRINQW
ncbi:MAG: hypothetical protein HRU75_09295 [Planctomycetia bacterium]|nr:MAG: hypothetical protein HRU75_09295 [Planctomycetia bacterium]